MANSFQEFVRQTELAPEPASSDRPDLEKLLEDNPELIDEYYSAEDLEQNLELAERVERTLMNRHGEADASKEN